MTAYSFEAYTPSKILRNHLHMGGRKPDGETLEVTSLYLERNGKPFIGVMGEYHFCRDHRENWKQKLALMKAGGITIVSSYLFWNYHERSEGEFDFSGNLDIGAFLKLCHEVGLEAVIRLGPWSHGECCNGGFPDWLLQKNLTLRDNNEDYLKLVHRYWSAIYQEVKDELYENGGCIIGIQLENELITASEHIKRLKELAIEIGLRAPIYTATGWNSPAGAELPVEEVMPVFGGYTELPWRESLEVLPPSVHYFFNRMRNDNAIEPNPDGFVPREGWQLPYERYPFATCEIGGGIENTHHRRSIMRGMDVYAMSLVKLGCGNNLVGYYMDCGGTHRLEVNDKGGYVTFNETKASGYPNDYPTLSYDFQAPISEFGELREHYRLLNVLHLFLADFGSELATMEAVDLLRDHVPNLEEQRQDTTTLRAMLRTNGESGYVFINHYERHRKLPDLSDVVLKACGIEFPPISVVGENAFFLPIRMKVGKHELTWATAQPIAKDGNKYYFLAIEGVKTQYCIDGEFIFNGGCYDHFELITLSLKEAKSLRRIKGNLLRSDEGDLYEENQEEKLLKHPAVSKATLIPCEPCGFGLEEYELSIGGERRIDWYRLEVDNPEAEYCDIELACDVAQIYVGGKLVADNYYYGVPWRVSTSLLQENDCVLVASEWKEDHYKEW